MRYTLWPLVILVVICYIFHRFGIMCQEKSGNPGTDKEWHFWQKSECIETARSESKTFISSRHETKLHFTSLIYVVLLNHHALVILGEKVNTYIQEIYRV
jgi:hypothetical protein